MTKEELEIKILALEPQKKYVIVVGRSSGISPEDLQRIVMKDMHVIFLMAHDVNDISISELDDFERYVHSRKGKVEVE